MTTVLLARHAESDWNAARRWQGHADRPLTELGRRQAEALAAELAGCALDAVYASDLRRAVDTAAAVAARHGLAVRQVRELREIDVGAWSGLTREEVHRRFPAGFDRWRRGRTGWDDGETYEELAVRVLAAVRRIADAHPGGRVLVVSHGGLIRALKALAYGISLDEYCRSASAEPNARVSALAVENGTVRPLD